MFIRACRRTATPVAPASRLSATHAVVNWSSGNFGLGWRFAGERRSASNSSDWARHMDSRWRALVDGLNTSSVPRNAKTRGEASPPTKTTATPALMRLGKRKLAATLRSDLSRSQSQSCSWSQRRVLIVSGRSSSEGAAVGSRRRVEGVATSRALTSVRCDGSLL